MTWDGIVTKYHNRYAKMLGITPNIHAYIQSQILQKTLECVSFDRRRGEEDAGETTLGDAAAEGKVQAGGNSRTVRTEEATVLA